MRREVSALDHEPLDYAVEAAALEVKGDTSFLADSSLTGAQLTEVLRGLWAHDA